MAARATNKKSPEVLQLRVSLRDVSPEVWRCIRVPDTYTFWDLHVAIQDVMGWEDSHLHEFQVVNPTTGRTERVGIPDEDTQDENGPTLPGWERELSHYFTKKGSTAHYLYDFGDEWQHKVVLEERQPKQRGIRYPHCLAGARACPPEECGGPPGYEEFLAAIQDPEHEEHDVLLEWVGGEFDPEAFDPESVEFDDPQARWRAAFEEVGAEDDDEDDEALEERASDPKILRAMLREVVSKQMSAGDPPATKATFERLRSAGVPEDEVWNMLCTVLAVEMFEVSRDRREFDAKLYEQRLKALPKLPFD